MNPAALPPPPPGPLAARRRAFRPPRGRARLILLALLLLALGVGGYVVTRGGWVNALRLPPTLDASTPRSQNGWVLEDIQLPKSYRGEEGREFAGFRFQGADYSDSSFNGKNTADAFGIWLNPPPGSFSAGSPTDAWIDPKQNPFVVSARLSTGESLFLSWHLRRPKLVHSAQTSNLLFVSLPTGYPDTCRFVDITVSDRHSHTAHWRFARLPRMRHAIAPPVKVTDTVTKNGVTISAQAWINPNGVCGYLLIPTVPPSHRWELALTRREYTWEAFNNTGEEGGQPLKTKVTNKVTNKGEAVGVSPAFQGYADFNCYPRANRFLRLTTELRQFETLDEPLIFHNVAVRRDLNSGVSCVVLLKPISQTTPSGVTVTLPAQDEKSSFMAAADCLNVLVFTSPRITFQQTASLLPDSPLARTYGKPVHLSLRFSPPGKRPGGSEEQGNVPACYALSLRGTRPLPPVLKNFTITVHQRVDLQTTLMTFTLPIADHAPPFTFESDYNDYTE